MQQQPAAARNDGVAASTNMTTPGTMPLPPTGSVAVAPTSTPAAPVIPTRGTHNNAVYLRLKASGMDDEELQLCRSKLSQLVKEVDPDASLAPEVEEVLLELSAKFVESAAKFGCKLAQHRGAKYLEIADLRYYVETQLGVHVPGFGTTTTGNLPASFYADALEKGGPGRPNDEHLARLKLRKKAHVVLEDNFAIAVQSDNKRAKTAQ